MSTNNVERPSRTRHPRYYDSECLTFAVDGYLFRLPVRRLKESTYFQDMLGSEHLGSSVEGKSDEHAIELGSITSFEMESFIDVLDARIFGKEFQREWKKLAAALHLSTMWEFEDARARLIKEMSDIINQGGIAPLDRIEASIQGRISDWLHPAYKELCDREEGVTGDEAKRLGMDRLAAIYRVRDRQHAKAAAQQARTAAESAYAAAQNSFGATRVTGMVNTLSTPWIDPAHQQQRQGLYYDPQQGPPQPWQNTDPDTPASSGAQYPGSGPGWADQAYYASQSGYHNNSVQYPADPRTSQQYPVDPRTSQQYSVDPRTSQGYPTDPRASGAYYPTSASGHTSPINNQPEQDVLRQQSFLHRPSSLPYMNKYGVPQPGPSVASTPAPPSSTAGASADPFNKHASAAASAAAGPSDHDELPPPSYDEAGLSAQPFVPQDAKGRPQ
ncbi:hypothetical protein FRC01_004846 [Tulasnella sp. 417]|nr:hypothetical protein FRC01_004846 [Tulasnella sp. 417]